MLSNPGSIVEQVYYVQEETSSAEKNSRKEIAGSIPRSRDHSPESVVEIDSYN